MNRRVGPVFLIENCTSHITNDVIDFFVAVRVRVVTFASHIMNIFRLLDLTLFRIFEREEKYWSPFDELTTMINFMSNEYGRLA
jgi:hypothetical protein